MFNKNEELDDKELNLTLTVYDENDIELDRIALSNQYFDGFMKAKDFSKDQEYANLVRRLSAIDIIAKRIAQEIGREEGIELGIEKTARNLLKVGCEIGMIIEATGLSKEPIEKLRD